ncbi:MAG: LapA family protein [Beijerinckiaceae bacterium]|nr:LapA family protein [Beijerinckiaceae bacterium]
MVKFLKLLVLIPVGIAILAFSIANRAIVTVSFDPFSSPDVAGAFVKAPLFAVMFAVLIVGVIIGGTATWLTQGSHRRKARAARNEAEQWQEEAAQLREKVPTAAMPGRVLVR